MDDNKKTASEIEGMDFSSLAGDFSSLPVMEDIGSGAEGQITQDDPSAVVIQNSVVGFAPGVPLEIRQDCQDMMLLAQLNAKKYAKLTTNSDVSFKERRASTFKFYDKYVETLGLGFVVKQFKFSSVKKSELSLSLDKLLVDFLTTAVTGGVTGVAAKGLADGLIKTIISSKMKIKEARAALSGDDKKSDDNDAADSAATDNEMAAGNEKEGAGNNEADNAGNMPDKKPESNNQMSSDNSKPFNLFHFSSSSEQTNDFQVAIGEYIDNQLVISVAVVITDKSEKGGGVLGVNFSKSYSSVEEGSQVLEFAHRQYQRISRTVVDKVSVFTNRAVASINLDDLDLDL